MNPESLVDEDRDPMDLLAEQFADLCRRGEAPTIESFTTEHPDHAEALKTLLPAVAFLERNKFLSRSGVAVSPSCPMPERLGHYRIVGELGRGGMGIVYEAIHEPYCRRVALKILHRHAIMDPKARQRFSREATTIVQMVHPNIVSVYDLAVQSEIPYYVMELIQGPGLDRVIATEGADVASRSPREIRERSRWVARLGSQATDALAYAHEHGVLHRDIKPSNLLLDEGGKLWLADFGLAKLCGDISLTSTGELPGTLRYLAPECLRKEGDARSDLYSLGLTLYELLLGRAAFAETDRLRLLREVQESQPIAPRVLLPAIPRDLETILLKAIAREPSERYDSARSLGDDLQRFLEDRPIAARRPSLIERAVRLIRRNPLPASLTATTVLFALIAAYFLTLYVLAPRRPRPDGQGPPRAELRQGREEGGRLPPTRGQGQPGVGPQGRPLPPPFDGPPPRRFPAPPRPAD